ncbi:type III-D CRISPR-associated RAMP protein Csx10 [Iningainema tapete]|uniref:CRISPR-associated RAMP protein Csx10 n=1 Tax=Iningainema tapete BLCC-T55 TaxID=2748662 RepID=A0A8J6XP01_9CYAN|nr:CRISPR-associated RAMP protein Csx10 [Iningainema tapete BLCC-T55]
MKRIQLQIKALSPLAIARQKPGGSVSEVEDYIPGTVIRGAFAAQILQQSGHLSTNLAENGGDFQALFLGDEPAIFQHAYPATLEINDEIVSRQRVEEIKVLPATALSSKTKPGFKPKNNGVFDTLIDRFCAEGYGYPYDPNCPTDGERVDTPGISFYSQVNKAFLVFWCKWYYKLQNNQLVEAGKLDLWFISLAYYLIYERAYKQEANKRLLTRVGINRRRATAEEEILYSIEVLNESKFKGEKPKPVIYNSAIVVTDTLADSLWQFIHARHQDFRLGGSTSRGLGKVEIKVIQPKDVQPNVEDKVTKFTQTLQKRWQEWNNIFGSPIKESPDNRTFFTLDLQADAILTEQWRRTTVISATMLQQFTGVEAPVTLEAVYSSYDYRSGWNAAWGLMKDVELVTRKGSVYLFSTTEPDKWYEALAQLELTGVGDRTCEGFGQVLVCNDFHLVFREFPV